MRLKSLIALLLVLLASCGTPEYVGASTDPVPAPRADAPL